MIKIFISSVQSEFSVERKQLCEYIRKDALLGKFFQPFIFEELPAINNSAPEAYLTEAANCDIYIGLLGRDYGYEDSEGVSPTEREYDVANAACKYKLVFIKHVNNRHHKEQKFIDKVEQQVVRKTFSDYDDLRTSIYTALIRYLEEKEYLRLLPWDATFHPSASLDDIDHQKVKYFVDLAKEKRNSKLKFAPDKIVSILQGLNMISPDNRLTNSALLLFAKDPQRFFVSSEVKCMLFPSTVKCKPILSYQVYRGSLFEMIDSAVGFVMQHIDAYVGTHSTTSVNVQYEIPIDAVTEVIVNACTHRSYESNGSVQIELYPDRLVVRNPGSLPYGLTPKKLKEEHSSLPTNPILANPVFLAGYIERIGSGTTDVISACEKVGLKTPEFIQEEDFCAVLWRKTHMVDQKTHMVDQKTHMVDQKTHMVAKLTKKQCAVIDFCAEPKTSHEIIVHLGITYQARAVKRYITDLVLSGHLLPLEIGKSSPNQKYIKAVKPDEGNSNN